MPNTKKIDECMLLLRVKKDEHGKVYAEVTCHLEERALTDQSLSNRKGTTPALTPAIQALATNLAKQVYSQVLTDEHADDGLPIPKPPEPEPD